MLQPGNEKRILQPDTDLEKESEFVDPDSNRPDGWLVRAWKNGDEHAAEILFDRYALRLIALVANRLSRRYRSQVDADEVVQSALASFFAAARGSRIQISESISLWRLLATFARRKMARSIERQSAAKRGGDRERVSLDVVATESIREASTEGDIDEFVERLKAELSIDLFGVVEGILSGRTQTEIAKSLGIDERTVRRRLERVRTTLSKSMRLANEPGENVPANEPTTRLPHVHYNQFVLGKLIGRGGFGKVYRASMQSDGRTVAVKFLRKAFWQDERACESFVREINVASKINHPGILRYLGYGHSPHGGPYVLSRWIDGRPMHRRELPHETQFGGWLLQICEAVQAVHDAGLVHGDLTPANVLIDSENRVTITDFGFSQASYQPRSSVLGGTIGFAAPEQVDSAFGVVNPKTDIYAIGGLVHWYVHRESPNAGSAIAETVMRTLAEVRGAKAIPSGVNPAFQTIMQRSLQTSPADRTITLREMIELLSTPEGSA